MAAFYIRVGNGTREITDPAEKQKFTASRSGSGTPEKRGVAVVAPVDDSETIRLDSWDLGDVLAIVEKPKEFRVPERAWTQEGIVDAAVAAAGFALPVLWAAVPLVVLAARTTQIRGPGRSPHVALMALEDAKTLVERDLLFFPNGGPSVGQVYGRHPLRRRDYLPYASYHQLVLHEKSIEAARYLLSLGARDVEITCHQSTGKEEKAEAGVVAPSVDDVSLTMGFGRDDTGKLAIRITGAGKRRQVPDDLLWPSQDPMFKLARDAAQAGADTFHFGLKAAESGSVNARAAVKLQKELGLGLGGEYKRWEDLSFTVDAAFGESRGSAGVAANGA